MRFVPYDEATEPNVVVAGSPNPSTVLTLSHWPGLASPEHTWADTSAEMAFRYLDAGGELHGDADVVTNNHFDQDGLVGVFAMADPVAAEARRELLLDVARAGDFATPLGRRAARVSMAISSLATSAAPAPYAEQCAALYAHTLEVFVDLLDHPRRYRTLWEDEDAELTAGHDAVASGRVKVVEVPDLDLAVIELDPELAPKGGHRFGGRHADGLHPMALHATTSCVRLLVAHGERYSYTDRYETWVQYRSRPLPRRVDLGSLAEELTSMETGGASWTSTPPSELTPLLEPVAGATSSLPFDTVVDVVQRHLRTAPPAWDPYDVSG
jgi:hypothetical protein